MAAFTALTTTTLPDAVVGQAYEASVAVNGSSAAELTLEAGTTQTGKNALPAGLSYGTDGRITGTPTGAAGTFSLSVKVTDGTNTKDNAALTLVIHPEGAHYTDDDSESPSSEDTIAAQLDRMWVDQGTD